jgi:hypothetical protein
MALYKLYLYPLLRTLENRLTGFSIGERGQSVSVLAYHDDITVFLSNREDIEKVHHAIRICEQAIVAHLNPNKPERLLWAVGQIRLRHWELSYSSKSKYVD